MAANTRLGEGRELELQMFIKPQKMIEKIKVEDNNVCHSIRCPLRTEQETVKTEWDIRKCFEQLRFDKENHLGMGDIRLTIGMQEEICELVERFYRCR